jgi:hypothetical protein
MKPILFTLFIFLTLFSCINKKEIKNAISDDYRYNYLETPYWSLDEIDILNVEDCCSPDFISRLNLKSKKLKMEDLVLKSKLDSIYGYDTLSEEEVLQNALNDLAVEISYISLTGKVRPMSELDRFLEDYERDHADRISSHLNKNEQKEKFLSTFDMSNDKLKQYKIVKVMTTKRFVDYDTKKESTKIDTVEYMYISKDLVIKL